MYPRIARMLKVCNVFDIIYSKKLVKICRFQIASPLRNQVCFPHYDMKTVMGVIMRRSNLNFNIPPPPPPQANPGHLTIFCAREWGI